MPAKRNPRPEILDSVALLVVDAQDCFIDTLSNKEEFLLRACFAIEAANALKIHTIFTEQAADKLGPTNAKLLSLATKSKVFHKKTFSALSAPGIESYLRDQEIYHLLIIGLETPICIYQTGLQAQDEDIDVTFLHDALGARRQEDAAAVIDTLRRLGCLVLPSEAVFYSLLGDVENPYFSAFNNLVKDYTSKTYNEDAFQLSEDEVRQIRMSRRAQDSQRPAREHARKSETNDAPANDRPRRESREEESDERRSRRPRRRSRGGRNRNERRGERRGPDDQKPNQARPQKNENEAPKEEREPRRNPSESRDSEIPRAEPRAERHESPKPSRPEDKPSPKAERREPESKPAEPIAAKPKPAKKAARKAAKKVAKKAAKKAVKKTARKAAKKVAKKKAAED